MILIKLLPVIFSCLLLSAHYLRAPNPGIAALWCTMPLVLFLRRRWVPLVATGMLLWGGYVWLETTVDLAHFYETHDMPRVRMALILGGVALMTAASPLVFFCKSLQGRYLPDGEQARVGLAAFTLTLLCFGILQNKVHIPVILLERFLPGGGWLEGFWLSVYAGWIAGAMLVRGHSQGLRSRIWMFFSIVFFAQLVVGLAGVERFLMTGDLHLPVPALIVAGPIFRGNGLFMLILFTTTVLLVGPAWCSHLCYIGAWDDIASRRKALPSPLPAWSGSLRLAILVAVVATAGILRLAGVPSAIAAVLVILFMITGIMIMVFWSRKKGTMVHCVSFCPISWFSTRLGRISPFRIRIEEDCSACGACSSGCRYDALSEEDIAHRRTGKSCTLCGDCVALCGTGNIVYSFPGLTSAGARALFVILVVSLHALFLGVARM